MFSEDKKKDMKESLLEKLIDHLMTMPDGGKEEEGEDCGPSEVAEGLGDKKPKASLEIMSVEAKPKEKFKLSDGTEMEDESLEDILKRKKKEA